jgi:hypothetical protein
MGCFRMHFLSILTTALGLINPNGPNGQFITIVATASVQLEIRVLCNNEIEINVLELAHLNGNFDSRNCSAKSTGIKLL